MKSPGMLQIAIGLLGLLITGAIGYYVGLFLAAGERRIRCPYCSWLIPQGTALCPECGKPVAGINN